jgi:replication-associated recombination protein RarA
LETIQVASDIKDKVIEYCNENQLEISEEYLRRVELLYNQVNPQTVTQRKVILFGKPGVGKTSMIKLTTTLINKIQSNLFFS